MHLFLYIFNSMNAYLRPSVSCRLIIDGMKPMVTVKLPYY